MKLAKHAHTSHQIEHTYVVVSQMSHGFVSDFFKLTLRQNVL